MRASLLAWSRSTPRSSRCVGRLAEALERFGGYGERLAHAVDQVQAGEKDWFTKPTIDSYHTVWFELHENLLATLGVERGKETS